MKRISRRSSCGLPNKTETESYSFLRGHVSPEKWPWSLNKMPPSPSIYGHVVMPVRANVWLFVFNLLKESFSWYIVTAF
jgi:hypothetical protein